MAYCRGFAQFLAVVLALLLASPPRAKAAAPLAAAAAIVSIASNIKGLFDAEDQKKTQREILQKLDEIKAKLTDIDKKLTTILERFAELEFHIDQKFEEQRKIDVMTAIKRIHQHYQTWTSSTWKAGANPAVPDPAVILEELRRTTTALRETPSFANYVTVAMAMAYERLMLVHVFHVKPNDPDMQRGFEQYAEYFSKDAAASTITGAVTVGLRWSQANSDWASFQQAFNSRLMPLRCNTGTRICCENPPNWWYVGEVVYRYQGDLLNGFTQVAEESNLLTGPGGTAALLCRNSDNPVYPRRAGCPTNVGAVPAGSCDLSQQHAMALTKKQVLDDLNAALDSLRDFNSQAEQWAGITKPKSLYHDPRDPVQLDFNMMKALEANPQLKVPR